MTLGFYFPEVGARMPLELPAVSVGLACGSSVLTRQARIGNIRNTLHQLQDPDPWWHLMVPSPPTESVSPHHGLCKAALLRPASAF